MSNKKTKFVSLLMSVSMFLSCFTGINLMTTTNVLAEATDYKAFNFTASNVDKAINLNDGTIPLYSAEKGYGFVSKTGALTSRTVSTDNINWDENGFKITEDGSGTYLSNKSSSNYNFGGLVFRVDVEEAGAYGLKVKLAGDSNSSNTYIAPTGMQASRITGSSAWDSAGLVKIKTHAKWEDSTTWSYDYVTGTKFIEFEIEPTALATSAAPKTVQVASIEMTKISKNVKAENELPTVYALGDSTLKTYTFEEAGMSGWGQIINRMFDLSKVNVINYSMGGRSFKSMYTENRFNDILMNANEGDYVLIHSAHNDESTDASERFGRGTKTGDDALYTQWLTEIYIPSLKSRGIIPVLVTPMPRTNNGTPSTFNPNSPKVMKDVAAADEYVEVVDLYENAKTYIATYGQEQTIAIYMSIEAGESPGKTNDGSYANGHPSGKIDGTHYKEAAAKVWCKIIAEQIYAQANSGSCSENMKSLASYLDPKVVNAIKTDNWEEVYPEWAKDVSLVTSGNGSYYRNQIEKLIQIGAMSKDANGNFRPAEAIKTNEFISSLCSVWALDLSDAAVDAVFKPYYTTGTLTREVMAAIILDAYKLRFGTNADGSYKKPTYMTKYNGSTISPDDPNYDPNLTGSSAQYYPLVGWGNLTDKKEISLEYAEAFYNVYNLGLMRSETGIERGKMKNGTELQPKLEVTRAKAAKELWFLWVLGQNNVLAENQITKITTDGATYKDVVYKAVSYTAPNYEFTNVNIDNSGKLSTSLVKNSTAASNDKLVVKLYNADNSEVATKEYSVSESGAVSALDVTLTTGQYAIMQVLAADNTALSAERKVTCTKLIIPVRSYTASTVAGIKNGTLALKTLSAEETASIDMMSTSTDEEGTLWWKASENVTANKEIFTGLVPTLDMTYTKASHKTNDITFDGYVSSGVNGYLASDSKPERSGFLFTPEADGVLTAYVHNLGATKNFVIIENSAENKEAALVSSTAQGLSGACCIQATVKAGVEYYISVLGSKGRFVAISYSAGAPVVSTFAKSGETVEITATPNSGYVVDSITVTDDSGNTIDIISNSTKTVSTFIMPEANVSISAKFVEGSNPPEPPITTDTLGDIDGIEGITANDSACLLKYISDPSTATINKALADVDGNGILTAADAACILAKALNNSFVFPIEVK